MDSLAALALATGKPGEELLQRHPQNRDDYLVSRRMMKHIQYGSIYQSVILLICAFIGDWFIPEPNALLRYELAHKQTTIYPGWNNDWSGEKAMFSRWHSGATITKE